MVSNLSTIGFAFARDDDFTATMTRLANEADARGHRGSYSAWQSPTGAQLWFHVADGGSEVVGLTPFFEGQSSVSLKVTNRIVRPGDTSHEGALMAWVNPSNDDDGIYPLVFDVADFLALASRQFPARCTARIVGFAHQLRAFPSAAAYDEAQTSEPKFAAQSFVPVGMFASANDSDDEASVAPPSSNALLTGRVTDILQLVNEVTGQPFYALLVESLDASFDIVADPNAVEGDIVKGGTVEVSCGLFGRLLD